eukprot:gene4758-8486_t
MDGGPAQLRPDLSGVWEGGGAAAGARYFLSRTAEPSRVAAPPNSTCSVACLSADVGSTPTGGCGWDAGSCAVVEPRTGAPAAGVPFTDVRCLLGSEAATGTLAGGGGALSFSRLGGGSRWRRSAGRPSGLWHSDGDMPEYYVVDHDAASGGVAVWRRGAVP